MTVLLICRVYVGGVEIWRVYGSVPSAASLSENALYVFVDSFYHALLPQADAILVSSLVPHCHGNKIKTAFFLAFSSLFERASCKKKKKY